MIDLDKIEAGCASSNQQLARQTLDGRLEPYGSEPLHDGEQAVVVQLLPNETVLELCAEIRRLRPVADQRKGGITWRRLVSVTRHWSTSGDCKPI